MRRFCAAIITGFLLVLPSVALSWDAGSWSGVRRLTGTTTLSMPGLGTTSTDGLVLENTTAAAAGAQQISPRTRWTGQGWETNTGSSQQTDYVAQLVPVQGAAAPQARLDFNYAINGGALQATPTISLLNGNVGIGTTGSGYKLDVNGTSIFRDDLLMLNQEPISFVNTQFIKDNSGGGLVINSGAYKLQLQGGTDATNGIIELSTNTAVRMVISNNGNFGMNQTTFGTSATKVLSFGGPATAPTTRPADAFTLYPFDVNGAGTMGLAWMSEDNGIGILGLRNGFGTITPDQFAELEQLETITGGVTDGYAAALRLDPGYTAATALTVSRHNYIDVQSPSVAGAGPAAVTDAALFRFDAAIATHKALVAGFNTTDSGAHTTAWAGGIVINVNGTLYKIPIIAY